jgi:hypothetical protein
MEWWRRLFSRRAGKRPEYRVAFCLYTADGKRSVEVRERRDGGAYYVERVWVEGTTFRDRTGEEIGPYETPEAAEAAAVSRGWFPNGKDSN